MNHQIQIIFPKTILATRSNVTKRGKDNNIEKDTM